MTEPTIDFRRKYRQEGYQTARAESRAEMLETLEEIAGSNDVEMAVERAIMGLRKEVDADKAASRARIAATSGAPGSAPTGGRRGDLLSTFASDLDRQERTETKPTTRAAASRSAGAPPIDIIDLMASDLA